MVRRRGNKNTCSMSAEYDCDAGMFEQSHQVQDNCSAGLFSVQSETMMAVLLRVDARGAGMDNRMEHLVNHMKQTDDHIKQLQEHLLNKISRVEHCMGNLVPWNAIEALREQLQNVSVSYSSGMYALLTGRNWILFDQ